MKDKCEVIQRLGVCELLCQLAEEASELSQAALKLRRSIDGKNPTPISEKEAIDRYVEEWADVNLCHIMVNVALAVRPSYYPHYDLYREKFEEKENRWAERLREMEDKK